MPKRPFIYFDMGNVLLTFSHQLAAKQTAELCGIPEKLAWQILFDEGLHWEYERGELAEEQFLARFCQRARSESGFAAPDPQKFDLAASDIFELNTRILPIVFGLRGAGYTLGVLSNTSSAHWRYCTSRFPFLLSLFHRHALSFKIGVMKPSAAIYTKATEIAAISPAEILFFDDRPENISAATAAGWDAVLFTTPATAARDLASRGIVTNY
ncbi:MAG: HAD family phosphatase [Planctomycetales bacterium]|nr:HAD family phosphatase [Planctomycetales bacterium]